MSAMTAVATPVATGKRAGRATPSRYRAYTVGAGAALVLVAITASALIVSTGMGRTDTPTP